ncbi:MAG: hypothetical protein M1450_04185 [Patescibacteria group bacterium]|nr:hypothetical protein [Patescibacteria group bacterium]
MAVSAEELLFDQDAIEGLQDKERQASLNLEDYKIKDRQVEAYLNGSGRRSFTRLSCVTSSGDPWTVDVLLPPKGEHVLFTASPNQVHALNEELGKKSIEEPMPGSGYKHATTELFLRANWPEISGVISPNGDQTEPFCYIEVAVDPKLDENGKLAVNSGALHRADVVGLSGIGLVVVEIGKSRFYRERDGGVYDPKAYEESMKTEFGKIKKLSQVEGYVSMMKRTMAFTKFSIFPFIAKYRVSSNPSESNPNVLILTTTAIGREFHNERE